MYVNEKTKHIAGIEGLLVWVSLHCYSTTILKGKLGYCARKLGAMFCLLQSGFLISHRENV